MLTVEASCISGSVTASWQGILENLDSNIGLARFARLGAWNDADMLEVPLRTVLCRLDSCTLQAM